MSSENIQTFVVEQLKRHGLPMLFLSVAVWYFEAKVQELERLNRACNDLVFKAYVEDRAKLIEALVNNTAALNNLSHANDNPNR